MQVANGQLTILNPHTATPQVFWNGTLVPGVRVVSVNNDADHNYNKVSLAVSEDPVIAEMQAAGIAVKRV